MWPPKRWVTWVDLCLTRSQNEVTEYFANFNFYVVRRQSGQGRAEAQPNLMDEELHDP